MSANVGEQITDFVMWQLNMGISGCNDQSILYNKTHNEPSHLVVGCEKLEPHTGLIVLAMRHRGLVTGLNTALATVCHGEGSSS